MAHASSHCLARLTASALLALSLLTWPAEAQTVAPASDASCTPSWLPTFGGEPGISGTIWASAMFDDGAGPALHVAGSFSSAGGVPASGVACWNGSSWEARGTGLNNTVWGLTTFDDGTGTALYACGRFLSAGSVQVNGVARWDGSDWTPLGTGLGSFSNVFAYAMAVFDDGSGPALYVGGSFDSAGGTPANNIARWDGSSWSAVGGGSVGDVDALAVYDDGSGPALYAGGSLFLDRWDGSAWTSVGAPVQIIETLVTLDDGGGPLLYAGGGGLSATVATWDGSTWSAFPTTNGGVAALVLFDSGGGPVLHAGINSNTGVAVQRWNGAGWELLGSGATAAQNQGYPDVNILEVFPSGSGGELVLGGSFDSIDGVAANGIAAWNGTSASSLGQGTNARILALEAFDDGGGTALFAGGAFVTVGGSAASRIARWDGSGWTGLGSGMDHDGGLTPSVQALFGFNSGGGPALFAGGQFTSAGGVPAHNLARWNGSSWSAFGDPDGAVLALARFDDGGGTALYAGGWFDSIGGTPARGIARWDGTAWSQVGTGLDLVWALTVFDDGTGPALYAGGLFGTVGGVMLDNIARWDGTAWAPLGSGTDGTVQALAVHDDGSGSALYAGGSFRQAGSNFRLRVARWDGTSWSSLANGVGAPQSANRSVTTLASFDDGTGPSLFVGGEFQVATNLPVKNLARWNGASWATVGSGVVGGATAQPAADATAVFDDGTGPALYVGGAFYSAPDSGDSFLARWGCAASTGITYCTAGISASGCQATLSATGTPSATATSGFVLTTQTVEGSKSGLFFFGTSGRQANPWGNGTSYQCVVPPVSRGGPQSGTGTGGLCDGTFAQDLNALWCPTCPKPAKNPGPGTTVQAQLWYRDPFNTSNQTTGLSDALEFVVGP